MIRIHKSVASFGAVALVAGFVTLAFPRAAHAVAAPLVQVSNTTENPAITQSVPSQASHNSIAASMMWTLSAPNTGHYTYPSGIVFAAGSQPQIFFDAASGNVLGHLTYN